LSFVRAFDLDPQRRTRIHPDRWDQLVREGMATPSWLAEDFNTGRRRALIAAHASTDSLFRYDTVFSAIDGANSGTGT